MGTDLSLLVTMLNPLEEEGLIKRERDSSDRLRHTITLTAAGDRKLAWAASAQREAEDELFSGLDGNQRGELRRLLVALRSSATCAPGAGTGHAGC